MSKRRSLTVPKPSAIPVCLTGRATQDYTSEVPSPGGGSPTFSFRKGDIVSVDKIDSDGNGFGTLGDGRKGWFPMEFLEEERPKKKKSTTVNFRGEGSGEGSGEWEDDEEGSDDNYEEDNEDPIIEVDEEEMSEDTENEVVVSPKNSTSDVAENGVVSPRENIFEPPPVETSPHAETDSRGQSNVSLRGKLSSFLR